MNEATQSVDNLMALYGQALVGMNRMSGLCKTLKEVAEGVKCKRDRQWLMDCVLSLESEIKTALKAHIFGEMRQQ